MLLRSDPVRECVLCPGVKAAGLEWKSVRRADRGEVTTLSASRFGIALSRFLDIIASSARIKETVRSDPQRVKP